MKNTYYCMWMSVEKQLINNFKYLTQILEGYKNNPMEYKICRKKRLLLLKNYYLIKDISFIQTLLESFIKEQLYFLSIRDFYGFTVLSRGGSKVLDWSIKHHGEAAVNSFIKVGDLFGAKDPPDTETICMYENLLDDFREILKKNNNDCIVVVSEFKRIDINSSPPQTYASRYLR